MTDTKLIPLTKGQYAIVDGDMYDFLMQWKWYYGKFYAIRSAKYGPQLMHRLITNAPDGMLVDHIDHNRLNNTIANLRVCSRSQNSWNMRKYRGTSQYKGVYLYNQNGTWKASITVRNKNLHLGYFQKEIDAAYAYDAAARQHFGEFALTNF